jgi:hypothetical protein
MPKKTSLACITNDSLLTIIFAKLLVKGWLRSPGESAAVNDILNVNARVVSMRDIDPLMKAKLDPEKAKIIWRQVSKYAKTTRAHSNLG